jgi:hypothetical protein
MRRTSLALALLLGLSAALPALAATDLRIQLNPALAELHAEDPAKADQVLDALNAIIEGGAPQQPPPATRSIDDPAYRSLIEGNPLLEEAWRIDPKAALDQLRDIVAAGGGG